MEKNFLLTLEYDGSKYHGWQKQKNDRTIQEEVEDAISTMTKQKITLIGSGRTDAGVHALNQTANFHCRTNLLPQIFVKGLNSLLPEDIIVKKCVEADIGFNARYDATNKTYRYTIRNRALPAAIGRQYEWFIRRKLDLDAMKKACSHIEGKHDFKAFEGTGSPRSHTVRNVYKACFQETGEGCMLFQIQADGFLRYMVRNLVGTLVEVGHGRISSEAVREILLSKDRANAGATAPPHGLCLVSVDYSD
ncbi:MAG: tRNA pseudouridine(38-40) synthase TruA [Desulfobacterales bacterium]